MKLFHLITIVAMILALVGSSMAAKKTIKAKKADTGAGVTKTKVIKTETIKFNHGAAVKKVAKS